MTTRLGVGCGITAIYAGNVRDYADGHSEFTGKKTIVTDEVLYAALQWLVMHPEYEISSTFPVSGLYTLKAVKND